MPLTETSVFTQFRLDFDENNSLPSRIVYRTTDGSNGYVNLSPKGKSGLSDIDQILLEIFEDIWEADGASFTGDNSTTIDVDDIVARNHWGASTLDELEEYESYNPLDANSYARYARKREFNAAIVQESTLDVDADTGKRSLNAQFDIGSERRTPASATFAYLLEAWLTAAGSGNTFDFRVYFPVSDGVRADSSEDTLHEQPDVVAFLAWINSIRITGPAVTNIRAMSNRTFSITLPGETDAFVFSTPGTRVFAYNSDQILTRAQFYFAPTTANTGTFSAAAFNSLFATTTVNIPTQAGIEVPVFGRTDVPTKGSEFDFGDGQKILLNNGAPVFQGKEAGTDEVYIIPLTGFSGRAKRVSDLITEDVTDSTKKMIDITATTVIYEGSDNVIVKFPKPSETMLSSGTDKIFTVQYTPPAGTADGGSVELQDWDDENIVTLQKGQVCRMQALVDDDGNGRLIGFDMPPRKYVNSGENLAFAFIGLFTVQTSSASSNHRFREIDSSGDAARIYIDEDAFERGDGSIPGNNDIEDITDWDFHSTLRCKKAGRIEYELTFGVRFDNDASGSLTRYHGPQLYRQRGEDTADPVEIAGFRADEHTGQNTEYDYSIIYNDEVEADDWLVPLFRYFTSTTVDLADLHYQNVVLKATLYQTYSKAE